MAKRFLNLWEHALLNTYSRFFFDSSGTTKSPVLIFQLPRYSAYYSSPTKSPVLIFQLPRDSAYYSCTTTSPVLIFQLPSYSATAPITVVLQRRQLSSSSSPGTPRIKLYYDVASSHLPAPQMLRVLQLYYQVASSHLPASQIRARMGQVALSPAFRALDPHGLRRGLRAYGINRTLACISRTRPARSLQRVARTPDKSHSRLHFAQSTRTISEGCARMGQITHDLRMRVARTPDKSHSHLHFARSTRTISAEGCAHTGQIALSPAFRALDTHDLRRGLRAPQTHRTLACIACPQHARSPQRVAFSVDAVRPTLRL